VSLSEGTYVIIVTLDGAAVGAGDSTASGTGTITAGEYHFDILAGDISPKSTLEGYTVGSTGTVAFTAGAAVALTLHARDYAGTARSAGGEAASVKVVFPGATVSITDHSDGTYGISFTASTLAGSGYQLAVTVDGEIIIGTYDFGVVSGPIPVTVLPGPPTAAAFLNLADVTAGAVGRSRLTQLDHILTALCFSASSYDVMNRLSNFAFNFNLRSSIEAVVLPVRVTDALGNPISDLASGSSPRLVLSFDDVANSVAPTEPSVGVYRYIIAAEFVPVVRGSVTLGVSLDGVDIISSSVNVVPGPPTAAKTVAVWSSFLYTGVASGVLVAPLGPPGVNATVTISDIAGNKLTGAGDASTIAVSLKVMTAGGGSRAAASYEATVTGPVTSGESSLYIVTPLVSGLTITASVSVFGTAIAAPLTAITASPASTVAGLLSLMATAPLTGLKAGNRAPLLVNPTTQEPFTDPAAIDIIMTARLITPAVGSACASAAAACAAAVITAGNAAASTALRMVSFVPTASGEYRVNVTVKSTGAHIVGSPLILTAVAGDPVPDTGVVSIATTVPAGGISPTKYPLLLMIVLKDINGNAAVAAAGALSAGIAASGNADGLYDAVAVPALQSDGSYLADFSSAMLKAETTYSVTAKYLTEAVGSVVTVDVGVADNPSVAATQLTGGAEFNMCAITHAVNPVLLSTITSYDVASVVSQALPSGGGVSAGVAVTDATTVAAGITASTVLAASLGAVPAVAGVPESLAVALFDAAGNRVREGRGISARPGTYCLPRHQAYRLLTFSYLNGTI